MKLLSHSPRTVNSVPHISEGPKAPLLPINLHTDTPSVSCLMPHDILVARHPVSVAPIPRVLKFGSIAKVCYSIIVSGPVDMVDSPFWKNSMDVEPRKPVGRVGRTPHGNDSIAITVEAPSDRPEFSPSPPLNPCEVPGIRVIRKDLLQILLGQSVFRNFHNSKVKGQQREVREPLLAFAGFLPRAFGLSLTSCRGHSYPILTFSTSKI